MASPDQASEALKRTIDDGEFYAASDHRIFREIRDAFPTELERLKNAYAVEGSNQSQQILLNGASTSESPSRYLFDHDFDEVNRTLVGVQTLRWIHNNDYDALTKCQPESVRLTRSSFDWLLKFFSTHIESSSDLFTLVLSMIINDLGKDPELADDFYFKTKVQIENMNHDTILLEAAKEGMIPSLDRLDAENREYVMLGLELGSELNAGQLAQAENVPINLEGLLHMRGHEKAFALKFMEQILDVAGAAGHIDHTCAKKLIEPVFQAFKTVHEVSLEIIAGNSNLRQGYDKVLSNRNDMLVNTGYRRLSVNDPEERALLRLLTMGRTADKQQAELFEAAFDGLDPANKDKLVQGLNVDGNEDETAVLPYYMPAIISEGLENIQDLPQPEKERAVTSLMRYLGRVLQHNHSIDAGHLNNDDDSSDPTSPSIIIAHDTDPMDKAHDHLRGIVRAPTGNPGIVIERNVRMARDTITSSAFRTNPDSLDDLPVPPGEVLKRRRTSHSL